MYYLTLFSTLFVFLYIDSCILGSFLLPLLIIIIIIIIVIIKVLEAFCLHANTVHLTHP